MTTPNAIWHPSPNFGGRRAGLTPSLIVVHYTAMASAEVALNRLCDPAFEVSAHYLIGRDGSLWHMVEESQRAWHAGAGRWQGQDDINSRSIGIELDNSGTHPFSETQMQMLEHLLKGIMARWPIPPEGVIGHSDMAPDRKQDPGPHFDWARLARQGLASVGKAHQDFREGATHAGYATDHTQDTILRATRLRYAPWRTGPLTPEDSQLAHRFAHTS